MQASSPTRVSCNAGPRFPGWPRHLRAPFIRGQPPCSVYSQPPQSPQSSAGARSACAGARSGSRLSATLIISAHSMRLRNTLQPYSYTPWMSPVACRALAAQPPAQ